MSSLAEVLSTRRKELGLTLLQIAEKMNVSEATVQRWESGNIKSLRHEKIGRLADILHVTPSMLMGWEEISEAMPSNILPLPNTYKVPLVGNIACGQPITAIEDIEEIVDVPDYIHADFALRCKGDSMINARIFNGDIVYIRKQEEVENGEIAAVRIEDEATLKKVYLYPDKIILEAANPTFKSLIYREEEMNNVQILGKAVAFTSVIKQS